jgi:hypothetical protein
MPTAVTLAQRMGTASYTADKRGQLPWFRKKSCLKEDIVNLNTLTILVFGGIVCWVIGFVLYALAQRWRSRVILAFGWALIAIPLVTAIVLFIAAIAGVQFNFH